MKWTLNTAAVLLLAGFGFAPQAYAVTRQCDRCTPQQMEAVAYNSLGEMAQWGPLYVVDLRGGVVRKYIYMTDWTPETDPETDPINVWPQEVAVEPHIVAGVQEGHTYAKASAEQIIVNTDAPGLPKDAYQALQRTDMDGAIDQYIKTMSTSHRLNEFAAWADRFAGGPYFNPKALLVAMVLRYQDGSQAVLYYDVETGTYKRKPDSSRDGSGNLIPEKKEQTVGITYAFPNSNVGNMNTLEDFVDLGNRLRAMGVPITDRSKYETGPTYAYVCMSDVCFIQIILQ